MAARKSRMHLSSIIPVNQTHEEIVKNIFLPGKFGCTITGNLQMLGIICLCANLSIILATDYCQFHPCSRKLNIGSAIANISTATALYFIFSCGYVVSNPAMWVRINIVTNLTLSICTIAAQSISMTACITKTHVQKSPGPIALAGGVCLILSCGSLFILYRYKELEDVIIVEVPIERKPSSEDRHYQLEHGFPVAPANSHLFSGHSDDDRKQSVSSIFSDGSHVHIPHIPHRKGSLFLKHEDEPQRRKSLPHVRYEDPHHQSIRRNLSFQDVSNEESHQAPARQDSPTGHHQHYHPHHHHHHHHHLQHYQHNKHKFSQDDSHVAQPHCFYSKRKTCMFTKHV